METTVEKYVGTNRKMPIRRKKPALLLITLCTVAVAGCFSVGSSESALNRVSLVELGMTSDQVMSILGAPYQNIVTPGFGQRAPREAWMYVHASGMGQVRTASVTFEDGRVVEVVGMGVAKRVQKEANLSPTPLPTPALGSGEKFTQYNVQEIKPGMSMTEVQNLIGPPYNISTIVTSEGKQDVATWVHASLDGSQSLTLTFVNGHLPSAGRGQPPSAGQAGTPPQ